MLYRGTFYSPTKAPRRVPSWETGPPGLAAAVSQSPGETLGALGEELGAPTKAGAAPPRRGLPDEGGGAPGPLLVRREPPLEG